MAKPSIPTWPGKQVPDGVLPDRQCVQKQPPRQDPRPPACRDLLNLERRRRLIGAWKHDDNPKIGSVNLLTRTTGNEAFNHYPSHEDNLTLLVYRYTRGYDTVDDEMGYGERIIEPLWTRKGDKLEKEDRTSQRTKTGRQLLEGRDLPQAKAKAGSGGRGPEQAS
jgi:hypothetical protein